MSATLVPVATAPSRTFAWRRLTRLAKPAFWFGAVILTVWLLSFSWAKWIDPLVDFGMQLYIPWRITEGEHLGREFLHLYGPLSNYFNATLFRLFGVSFRTLVIADLLIFAAIFSCLHFLLRRAFGFMPAAFATLAGIAVFGFGHLTGINNYTFAAPYSHEATHGMLLVFLLALALNRAWSRPSPSGLLPGLLLGLIALTKVEMVFAAVAALAWFAVARRWLHGGSPFPLRWALQTIAVAAGVALVAWVLMAWATDAANATLVVASGSLAPLLYRNFVVSDQAQMFLGTDHLFDHAAKLFVHGGSAVAFIWALSLAITGLLRTESRWGKFAWGAPLILWLAGVWWASNPDVVASLAAALPALLALGCALLVVRRDVTPGTGLSARQFAQFLLFIISVALLSRMALAPRFEHYGFIQALVATVWVVAFYVGEWPRGLATSRLGHRVIGLTLAGLVVGGVGSLIGRSRDYYTLKTQPIGVGGDLFYGYLAAQAVGPLQVELLRDYLVTKTSPSSTLLVAPEGLMINYQARRKSPLRIMNLLPYSLSGRDLMPELTQHPPDYVLLISRLVTDDSFMPFGADDAHGRPLLAWFTANYESEAHIGGDPLKPSDPKSVGWVLMKRKTP